VTRLLLERFVDAARRVPDRVAIAPRDGAVTYGELLRMSGAAASRIPALAPAGARLALLSENSPTYAAALYGAWGAGQAVVGLNPILKTEELERILRHADARTLAVDPAHPEAEALTERVGDGVRVVSLDELVRPPAGGGGGALPVLDDLHTLSALPAPSALPTPSADAVAAIVYTSGTTGHPKGVTLSHGNLAANTASIQASLPIEETDRALCVLPFQYSYGASVLHTHLTLGATLLLERSLMYPHQVLERATGERITSFAGVPSTFYLLLDRTDLSSFDLGALRYLTQAGGRMDPSRIAALRALLPEAAFYVMYGQTEASARLACLPAEELDRRPGSAGRAIPGVELEIRDEGGDPLPPGGQGEVYARGENVMVGYWADPEESSKVLTGGWLRTGDLGRMDADGYLFLEGRAREMIKSGAYRIAPAEIEEVIRRVEGVFDVAVVGADDPVLGEAIHAHVVARDPGPPTRRAIMSACKEHLARYKLPKHIHFREELPRTASGKVRKHLL